MTEDEALVILRGPDAMAARRAEAELWQLWCRAGVPAIDQVFARGVQQLETSQLEEAEATFTRVIEGLPAFAEGWNKRATVRYLARNFVESIEDCRQTLVRKPHHFGALSGQGLCHLALGQPREAARMFRRALEVHPHLTSVRQNLIAATGEAVRGNGGL